MGSRPRGTTLDRINNDGNYEPGNCRWATASEQNRNSGRAKRLTHDGKTLGTAEWAEITGIPMATIVRRLASGWSHERTLTQPMQKARP